MIDILIAMQQAAWDEYANAIAGITEQSMQQPTDEADAAAIARYRADETAELSRKMARIADATASLQAILTEEQRKTFNMVAHNMMAGFTGEATANPAMTGNTGARNPELRNHNHL